MLSKALYALYVVYCFEVGLFLIVFPWMEFWNQNLLLGYFPVLQILFLNNFFRGAVTGLGFANLVVGAWEIGSYRRYFQKREA
ncbi:MAG: hypothetical protein P8020_00105 [Acidobacteriota bacterium]|jgi:hypothetical protein